LRWLQSVFGSDGSPIVQYVVIFAVIFAALAAIVFTVRRLTGRSLALPGRTGSRGRQPRLGIVDVYELDRARQLILLRRDNVEHLLLVGGPNDVVVERNIQRTQRPLTEAALRPELAPDSLDEPLPDPLVQGGHLPEPARALPEMTARRSEPLFDPGFAMPVVVPPPVPRSSAGPPVSLPLDAALLGGDEPGQEVAEPLSPRLPEASPPPARESVNPRRILSRTAPPLVEARPEPASERRADSPATGNMPPAPSLAVPSDRRSVDPAVLSDMARQLQAALSRPSSAVTPAPPPAAPAEIDPVAAAMAATAAAPTPPAASPAPPPAPQPSASPPAGPPPAAPAPPAPVAPSAPRASAPSRPAAEVAAPVEASASPSVPRPEPIPSAPPPPPPAMPKAAAPAFRADPPPAAPAAPERSDSKASGNPFSVEEIEAEFARLLGRPLDKRS
jgi:flagellar protein FliO/FliZ